MLSLFSKEYKLKAYRNGEFVASLMKKGFSPNTLFQRSANPHKINSTSSTSSSKRKKPKAINKLSNKNKTLVRNGIYELGYYRFLVHTALTLPDLSSEQLLKIYENANELIRTVNQAIHRELIEAGLPGEIVIVREILCKKGARLHWHLVFKARNNLKEEYLITGEVLLQIWRRNLEKFLDVELGFMITPEIKPIYDIKNLSRYLTKQPTLSRDKFELPENIEKLAGRAYNITTTLKKRVEQNIKVYERSNINNAALLSFWWKWYCKIQNESPIDSKKFSLWLISLIYCLELKRADDIKNINDARFAEFVFLHRKKLKIKDSYEFKLNNTVLAVTGTFELGLKATENYFNKVKEKLYVDKGR